MAYLDDEGNLILTQEDKDAMQGGREKNWARNIINKIIWGDAKQWYDQDPEN